MEQGAPVTAMNAIPALSEQQIRARVGEESFRRGQQCVQDGAILDPRREEMTLKARCAGSRAEPYRLWATFSGRGMVAAHCSCPVGTDGACKHVAAVLLTWLHTPDRFLAPEDLDASLERRRKGELVVLVKQMLRQRPDLELLLRLFSSANPFNPAFRLGQEVAAAAESSRPHAAIKIYGQQAEALIALRTRGHYREACRLLGRMRTVYQGLGDDELWIRYIGALRERHRGLRALKGELVVAGF